jgi:hypothetical protein
MEEPIGSISSLSSAESRYWAEIISTTRDNLPTLVISLYTRTEAGDLMT